MKNSIFLITLFVSVTIFAQTPRTFYYNKFGIKTTVKEKWEERNGMKHGRYISYHEDSKRKWIGAYSDNKLVGKWIGTFLDRKVEVNFRNGQVHGMYKNINIDGSIRDVGNYSLGKKDGYWKEFLQNNEESLYQEGNYNKGKRVGKWKNTHEFLSVKYNNLISPIKAYNYWNYKRNLNQTKKGYTTYYDNDGNFIKCTNPQGIDLIEIARQEKQKAEFERIQAKENKDWEKIEKYSQSFTIWSSELNELIPIFIQKYPTSSRLSKANSILNEVKYYESIKGNGSSIKVYSEFIRSRKNGLLTQQVINRLNELKPNNFILPLEFNLDSYILSKSSEEKIISQLENISDWNKYVPEEPIHVKFTIHSQSSPVDDVSTLSKKTKSIFVIISLNRAFIIKSLLDKYVPKNEVIMLSTAYSLGNKKQNNKGESFLIYNESLDFDTEDAKKLADEFKLPFNENGNLINGITKNEELRKKIISNLKKCSGARIKRGEIPIELWYTEGRYGLGLENDLSDFTNKVWKICNNSQYKMKPKDYVLKQRR